MKKKYNLKKMISIVYITTLILPIVFITILSVNYTRLFLVDLSIEYNNQIINDLRVNIAQFFYEPERDINFLSEWMLEDKHDYIVESFLDKQRLIESITILDHNGIVSKTFQMNEDIIGFDYSNKDVYKVTKDSSQSVWSKAYLPLGSNSINIDYSISKDDYVIIATISLESLDSIFNETIKESDLIVGVTDESGTYILNTDFNLVNERTKNPHVGGGDLEFERVSILLEDYYATSTSIPDLNWYIVTYQGVKELDSKINLFLLSSGLVITIMVITVLFIGIKFNKSIFNNLFQIVKKTKAVRDGNYDIQLADSNFVEFNEISENFKQMIHEVTERQNVVVKQKEEIEDLNKNLEERIIERTQDLTDANQELEVTLENLKTTQTQLIESEKLASLGNLIAGLAHEMNTPLGICLTIVSYLKEQTDLQIKNFKNGTLRKSEFEKYLMSASDSEKMAFDNLQKAIDLISSFKQISDEQRNLDKRVIQLKDYMENITKSLGPQLKKTGITIALNCDDDIEIETIPLALYQIIVNLVMNSKIHAYENKSGHVEINVSKLEKTVEIVVSDSGKGISENNLMHIFEPFFTTNRGGGGTGIGLHIVYNTVTQNLKGAIKCESQLNKGTKFTIHLPLSL